MYCIRMSSTEGVEVIYNTKYIYLTWVPEYMVLFSVFTHKVPFHVGGGGTLWIKTLKSTGYFFGGGIIFFLKSKKYQI